MSDDAEQVAALTKERDYLRKAVAMLFQEIERLDNMPIALYLAYVEAQRIYHEEYNE